MADPMSGPITICPWCSAHLPKPETALCPSCGAALTAAPDAPADIKGVTTLDTDAILRARSEAGRPQGGSRLLSFITGELPVDTTTPASPEVFAPPPDEVRLEMLRLQLEAERADLTAETVALKADELARRGIHLSQLGGVGPDAAPAGEAGPGHEAAPATEPEDTWPPELSPDEPGAETKG
jgi:hypothetical protein